MSFITDLGWLLVGLLLAPLLAALAMAGLAFIVARQLYWWARGNRPTAAAIVPAVALAWLAVALAAA